MQPFEGSARPAPHPDRALLDAFSAGDEAIPDATTNPMAHALGLRILALDAAAGSLSLAFSPSRCFMQGSGVLQGGAVSAMLDFAMAFAVLARLPAGGHCATTNLTSAFLRPALPGQYVALGQVEQQGRKLAFARASLQRADGTAVASGTSTLVLL